MKESKRPHNEKGQRHGYWEGYYDDDTLQFKCNFINDVLVGYDELHWRDGRVNKRYIII